tara:strand:- start:2756 stop:3103 length:348 start_codon:yes stop_codon:yes gene_type:complete
MSTKVKKPRSQKQIDSTARLIEANRLKREAKKQATPPIPPTPPSSPSAAFERIILSDSDDDVQPNVINEIKRPSDYVDEPNSTSGFTTQRELDNATRASRGRSVYRSMLTRRTQK